LTAVALSDSFWAPRLRLNREVTLPAQYRLLEETGRLDNFRRAAGKRQGSFQGLFFNDSDVYKWLEAVAWTLAVEPDTELAQMADRAIDEVAAAQEPDGYLDTYYTFERAGERWTNLRDMHEMYCAGHLFQAAVAHYRATGGERLLTVARRLADHICGIFGPPEQGKRAGACGHPEIEMGLVELARVTGEPRYLAEAQFMLDVRGQGLLGGSPYHQDHRPYRELDRMTGHAVRALYLNAGAADLYLETGEEGLRGALDRMWNNMVRRQMYISGGVGSRYEGEAFGEDYELPNARAYTETCAGIASVMWNWRLLAMTGDARFADLLEHALYNATLPGLSLDGLAYFYVNPLADEGAPAGLDHSDAAHRRRPWFNCACCPPNVARTLASLPGYFYSVSDGTVWTHLYAAHEAKIRLPDGRMIVLEQRTRYPWEGDIAIRVQAGGDFDLALRIPGWAGLGDGPAPALRINGKAFDGHLVPGSYVHLSRAWQAGDVVELALPMPIRRLVSHPYALENRDRVALMRGPLLYCIEGADMPGVHPRDVVLPSDATLAAAFEPDFLGGVVVVQAAGREALPDDGWADQLYRPLASTTSKARVNSIPIKAIPYYAWANRAPGPMRVWIKTEA
jgi:DUF1680 family protein